MQQGKSGWRRCFVVCIDMLQAMGQRDAPVFELKGEQAVVYKDIRVGNDIQAEIHKLAKHKTVILISHRLANVVQADNIYVLENGSIAESGNHDDLLKKHGLYERLWTAQQSLENYGKEGENA